MSTSFSPPQLPLEQPREETNSTSNPNSRKVSTSLKVFRSYIVTLPNGELDVTRIISRECYLEWLALKASRESDEEARKFYRVLTNHVTGVDGRLPFGPKEEEAILALFRKRQAWPCFPNHLAGLSKGYRSRGYHEKNAPPAPPPPPPTAASAASAAIMMDTMLMSASTLDRILPMLSPEDALYLSNLGSTVVQNFGTPNFTLEDWKGVVQIFKFVILAKTEKCATQLSRPVQVVARELCARFSLDEETSVAIMDLTAQNYEQRLVMQNARSLELFGVLSGGKMAHGSELYGMFMAAGGAFLQPGKCFTISRQKNHFRDGSVRAFDMTYYCDPETFLLVLFGKLST